MTISSTTTKVSYAGNGSTTVFAYTFKIFADADLEVIVRSSTGTETTQTLTTHYTVSGAGSDGGGNVTFVSAPASGETVVIRRNLGLTQGTDYVENDPFPAGSHENALDRLTMITQGIQEELDRAIKASTTNTITSAEFTISAADRANKVFSFDGSGDLAVTQELGTYQGNWAASTTYAVRDLVKDTSTNNIFICVTAHTSSGSQPLTTNTDSAKWALIVDAASATTASTSASSSATAAAASAAAASTSASNASTSETNAATSATSSETAKTASETAQTASEAAQTAAETAQAAAETAYDNFDDRYLGAKASDPATDNDGDALVDGALYFDTTNNVMKVYDLGTTTWLRTTPSSSDQTNINTVSGIAANVTTVAGVSADVTTVAGISSDVTTVAADGTDIGTVATNIANVNTVAGNNANITTVAGISSDVTTVAADGTDIGTVSTNIANVNTVAGNNANVTTVAGISSNVTTVAGVSSDVTTVAGVSSDVTTVAGISSDVSSVAAQVVGYAFSTTTTMADPGSGNVRFNNATLSSVTAIAIDDLDSNGVDQSAYIALWDDSTNTVKGTLVFRTSGGDVATFNITGLTDNTGWFQIAVTHVASSGTFSNAEDTFIGFTRAGDKGADGAGSGDVSGPGASVTDNAVVRWDSTSGQLVQNSSVIVDDSGNLQTVGGFAAQGTGLPASGSGVEINFGLVAGEGTVQAFDRSGSSWEQLRLRGNQVAFDISGTEKARITSGGNFGIGISSASYPLHVSPGTSGEVARFNSTATVGATTDVVTFSDTNNFGLTLEGRSGGAAFKMNGTQTLALGQVANGDAITINGSGNVGIGQTNSSRKLEVLRSGVDDVNIAVISGGSGAGGASVAIGASGTSSYIRGVNNAISANVPLNIGGSITAFEVGSVEKMRISSSGIVGINTSSPTSGYALDVNGNIGGPNAKFQIYPSPGVSAKRTFSGSNNSNATLHIDHEGGYNRFGTDSSGQSIAFCAGGSTSADINVVFKGDGNVGMGGQTSPSYDLDVTGDINFTGTLYQNGSAFSGGSVVQVKSAFTDAYTTHANTNVDNPADILSVSITPTSASNKILVMGLFTGNSTNSSVQYLGVKLARGATEIGSGDATTRNSTEGELHSSDTLGGDYSKPTSVNALFLDSPATTSATTYKLQAFANHYGSSLSNSTLVQNSGGFNYNNKEQGVGACSLIVMEVTP